jgi:hypothetical protein
MKMCDCGHDIYGENRPFHLALNQKNDRITIISNENPPGPVDLNSVFIDEYFFGGVERFINKDIFDIQIFINFCFLCENIVLKDRIIISYDIFDSDFTKELKKEGILANTFWPKEATEFLF